MGLLRGGVVRAACWSLVLLVLLAGLVLGEKQWGERVEHKKEFKSPSVKFRPGDVKNKFYPIESPAGHFATVNFDAELVYENGDSVPLTDVYLHHWIMFEFAAPVGHAVPVGKGLEEMMSMSPAHVYHDGAGAVRDGKRILKQIWAKGGETRHLNSSIPAPYGLESGNVPEGYRSQWVLNVHGIDTRGAVNRMGCTECRCDLFTGGNRTNVPDNYPGGLFCCVDESRCKLTDDFNGDDEALERTIHLKYTWTYVKFDECVIPLAQMGIDVTNQGHGGTVEYTVEGHCEAEDFHKPECVDVQETVIESKYGGDLVYAVSHLHAYSLDSTLWGEDGRMICHSPPIYGHGKAAGDEKGYVVGIRHCNPSFEANGLGKVKKGEKLRYQVKYTRVAGPHTGVMGVLFMKIAEDAEIATPVMLRGTGNRKIVY